MEQTRLYSSRNILFVVFLVASTISAKPIEREKRQNYNPGQSPNCGCAPVQQGCCPPADHQASPQFAPPGNSGDCGCLNQFQQQGQHPQQLQSPPQPCPCQPQPLGNQFQAPQQQSQPCPCPCQGFQQSPSCPQFQQGSTMPLPQMDCNPCEGQRFPPAPQPCPCQGQSGPPQFQETSPMQPPTQPFQQQPPCPCQSQQPQQNFQPDIPPCPPCPPAQQQYQPPPCPPCPPAQQQHQSPPCPGQSMKNFPGSSGGFFDQQLSQQGGHQQSRPCPPQQMQSPLGSGCPCMSQQEQQSPCPCMMQQPPPCSPPCQSQQQFQQAAQINPCQPRQNDAGCQQQYPPMPQPQPITPQAMGCPPCGGFQQRDQSYSQAQFEPLSCTCVQVTIKQTNPDQKPNYQQQAPQQDPCCQTQQLQPEPQARDPCACQNQAQSPACPCPTPQPQLQNPCCQHPFQQVPDTVYNSEPQRPGGFDQFGPQMDGRQQFQPGMQNQGQQQFATGQQPQQNPLFAQAGQPRLPIGENSYQPGLQGQMPHEFQGGYQRDQKFNQPPFPNQQPMMQTVAQCVCQPQRPCTC